MEQALIEYGGKWELEKLSRIKFSNENKLYRAIRKRDQLPVVLKFFSDPNSCLHQANAMIWYDGLGCVKLLDADLEKGVLLVQEAVPGRSLANYFLTKDEYAIQSFLKIIKLLHRKPVKEVTNFEPLITYLQPLFLPSKVDPLARDTMRDVAKQLLLTMTNQVLLHGDLYHGNIVSNSSSEWIAIDPVGLVGEAAFESAAFICYPVQFLVASDVRAPMIARRVDQISQALEVERFRLQGWAAVFAMRKACELYEKFNLLSRKWAYLSTVIMSI